MGNPILIIRIALAYQNESESLVVRLKILLRRNANRHGSEDLPGFPDRLPDEHRPNTPSTRLTACHHATDGWLRKPVTGGDDPEIPRAFSLSIDRHQVPGVEIAAVGVKICAVLLDDKDVLAQRENGIQQFRREIGKLIPFKSNRQGAGHVVVEFPGNTNYEFGL
jgi:hypothetical protein